MSDLTESSLTESYASLSDGVGWVDLARDVVRVSGPAAVAYLHGQLSQDIEGLAVGASAWSLVLQPQGKIDAWVRVTRVGTDDVLLDVDGGFGAALLARLQRFKLRTAADLEALDWRCVAIRGPLTPDVVGEGAAVPFEWAGWRGVDLLGADPHAPAGLFAADPAAYEVRRIEAGLPRMGAELTERTIPAEAGVVEASVSFTKGCYTGQELVARIDSRGSNVPRRLRGLVMDTVVPAGTAVESSGRPVGSLTSTARHPDGHGVALGYISRDVEPPAEVECAGMVASVRALPLIS
jgi:folate-binding protein YgfZ